MKTLHHLSFLLLLAIFGLLVGCTQSKKAEQEEEKTTGTEEATSEDQGWITLFDGTSTDGWRGYGKKTLPPAWEIVDGTLHIKGSGRGEAGAENGSDQKCLSCLRLFRRSLRTRARRPETICEPGVDRRDNFLFWHEPAFEE